MIIKTKRNYGMIEISMRNIEDNFDEIVEMFYKMKIVVFRAETLYHKDIIRYDAFSPFFRDVPEGEIIPYYEIISNDGNYTVKEMGFNYAYR